MAEEQRIWSQRHVHESSIVSFGQFGTPTYRPLSGEWKFLRQDNPVCDDDEDSDAQHDDQISLKIFAEACILEAAVTSNVDLQGDNAHSKDFAELAPAASLIKPIRNKLYADNSLGYKGHLTTFGSAVWLSSDEFHSGNLTVPVIAFATGNAADTLQLACLSREEIEYVPEGDTGKKFRVPSIVGDVRTSMVRTESILQVSFSQQNAQGKGDNFLLVRSLTQTTIFEPLLHRDTFVHSSVQERSSLDLNPLVTLDALVTGGHPHVDSVFHPLNHRTLAIVDEEGNWSTWKIRGRRSTTARVLYQAHLGCSGRIFSWKYSRRPDGVGLYFDGWHKVVWLSSNGQRIDMLLVCNRRMIKVFDTTGKEICDIDARLDRGNGVYILDVQAGPVSNLCFILTSSRVLLFDLKEREWKDPASSKGPSLMCAFHHFQEPTNVSLRMAQITFGDHILVCLYSAISECLESRLFSLLRTEDTLAITISDTRSTILPIAKVSGRIATIILTQSEYVQLGRDPLSPNERLINVLVQYEESYIRNFWAIATTTSHGKAVESARYPLRLPPNRGIHSKRYADDAYDEDGIEGLITSTSEWDMLSQNTRVITHSLTTTSVARHKDMKRAGLVVDAIQQQHALPQSTLNVVKTLQSFLAPFRDGDLLPERDVEFALLGDFLTDSVRIQEIESLSDAVQQSFDIQDQATRSYAISICHGNRFRTLLSVYRVLFGVFIESLPAEVPDRFRVQKERQDRQTALEQYLSSRTIHAIPQETTALPEEGQGVADSSQMIFSDPIQDDRDDEQHIQSVSASQPLPKTSSELNKSDTEASPLLASISRLRTYTRIRNDDTVVKPADPTVSNYLSSILAHLPASCDDNPDKYDYQATMMSIAADKAESREGSIQATGRAQRRTVRLARARERAEASTPAANFAHSGARDKEAGNNSRGAESRNNEMLPIRSAAARLPTISWHDHVSQSRDRHVFSDGHMLAGISSPTTGHGGFAHTQPERGAFASRVEANSQSKSKKKRRVAGF